MNEAANSTFELLGLSLLLGLLVGLQRQHSASPLAGLRTFPLISVLGTLAAVMDSLSPTGDWLVPCGLLGLAGVIGVSKAYQLRSEKTDFGITTETTAILMYVLGAYVVLGDRLVAVAVAGGAAVLLQFKAELHGISNKLGDEDLRAIMTFVLISFVVLPILPRHTFDLPAPLDVLNPFEIWMMVVLMVGISLGGYLIYKFMGRNAGILLGGLLGGAISSTATTLSCARRATDAASAVYPATVILMIASTVALLRAILEVCIVAPSHRGALALPVGVMMTAAAATSLLVWLRVRRSQEELPQHRNPTELRSALVFAGLYSGVLVALSAAKSYVGGFGLYAVAVISGLTDMDAITLSAARLVETGPADGGIESSVGWRIIITAAMTNLCFKWILVWLFGPLRFAKFIALLFAVPITVGAAVLWLWT